MDTPEKITPAYVEKYYDKTVPYYLLFWSDKKSLGIHYGFWNDQTKNHSEALINQYVEASKQLKIVANDKILDAGCGFGGASIWLVENFDAECIGITLSGKQVQKALNNAKKRHCSKRTRFYKMDYTATTFENDSFDKVFGIESFCYTYPDSLPLFKEMYRILKPGGRIYMADGILLREPRLPEERKLLQDFFKGWCLNGLNTPKQTTDALQRAGFHTITYTDKTADAAPSSKEVYSVGQRVYPLLKLLSWIGIVSQIVLDNILAFRAQKRMWDIGLTGYGSFSAKK